MKYVSDWQLNHVMLHSVNKRNKPKRKLIMTIKFYSQIGQSNSRF